MNTLPEQRTNTTPAPRLAPPNELYLNAIGRYWDRIFYDVGSLTLAEQNSLLQGGIWSPYAYREGEVIVVPPKTARRKIHHYKDTGRFLDEKSQDICAIVVAGVGSSVYGTAALARNVADTYNFDVAGIVTGYGFWNWIIEALDGWFVLGQSERENLPSSDFIARSPDIKTLIEIILTIPPDLKYLVGHSKGSLMIDFVLRRFVQKHLDVSNSRYSDLLSLNVRTLGAVVSPPEQFTQVRQFMGQLDYLGNLNSHMFASYEEVPGAGHHLNPKPPIPLPSRYLDVCEVLLSEQDRYPKKNVSPWFWPPLPSRGVETA